MENVIASLRARRKTLQTELDAIDNAINALQKVCKHDWIPDGHDSHHEYEVCKICGETAKI
jgi:hypothetical protein